MRCGFWPLVHWSLYPNSSKNFPCERTGGVFSKSITVTKSNSRTYTVASSFVCTSLVAVITVVVLLDVLTVSNSASFRSFLLTRKRIECTFVFLFEIFNFPGKFPRISAGTSLPSRNPSWRSVLKFHSVWTSLVRIFDLYFSKRWSFLFPDTCFT